MNNEPNKKKPCMVDWWAGTVFLAFFPILVSIIINMFNQSSVDFQKMVGNGELILSAFAISAPTLIRHFNNRTKRNKHLFYSLLFSLLIQLVIYVSIRTSDENSFYFIFFASLICVIWSVIVSWKSEIFFKTAIKGQANGKSDFKKEIEKK